MKHDFQPLQPPWSERLYERGGKAVARLIRMGSEVHFEIHPEHRHRVIYRHVTREFLRPVFEEHGFLTTRTHPRDFKSQAFIERLGFERTWSDENFDYYMLTALPFGKKEK